MTIRCKRAITIRPDNVNAKELIAPIHQRVGKSDDDKEDKEEVVETDYTDELKNQEVWEQMQEQVEDLNVRIARHFEFANDGDQWRLPMIKFPPQPTKEAWLQHQLTHTHTVRTMVQTLHCGEGRESQPSECKILSQICTRHRQE